MKTHSYPCRPLQLELLESRALLSAGIPSGDVFFWHAEEGKDNVVETEFIAPASDPDGNPKTETSLHVFVSVGMSAFHEFATMEGTQALPASGAEALGKWFTIPVGGRGDLSISLKSLDDYFAQSPDFRTDPG